MKTKITDFNFQIEGYGRYKVTYTSPSTGKQWSTIINDMTIIDATRNSDKPKQKDLDALKWRCKNL